MSAAAGEIQLVDLLLREQESLSAVERFSQRHADAELPLQARYYRDLIPATPPGPDEQYAFRVDLDACTGCKACVTACHSLNGLGEDETWRDVGLLVGGEPELPVLQTVTTACHHCDDPGCLSGCPVRAYEKDPVTGIVRHLDDQCIGCQYCMLKCPYDVPKYDTSRGIVRKCDMCSDRLSAGEAPACVQGCPNEAISIETVPTGSAGGQGADALLPAEEGTVPDSDYTRPTTRYVGEQAWKSRLRPADTLRVEPGDPHRPLSVMLVLSQLAVGIFVVEALAGAAGVAGSLGRVLLATVAAGLGLGVANLHLGRPQYAFRAVLGLGTSWMSREIVTLGAFAGAAGALAASLLVPAWLPSLADALPLPWPALADALRTGTAAVGLLAVLCSVMIYADTHRALWRFSRTGPLFFTTTAVLGLGGALFATALAATFAPAFAVEGTVPLAAVLALAWTAAGGAKLHLEARWLEARDPSEATPLTRSRLLLDGALAPARERRRKLGWVGGLALPALTVLAALVGLPPAWLAGLSGLALLVCAAGEWMERDLFFRACAPVGMPGA